MGERLLIVDDSEIDRIILKNILYKDFEVIEADNGYSALGTILSGQVKIDAILLDISMPVLDGFDVLKQLEENHISHIPVLLITAEATKANVERAVQYHVAGFISKPFDATIVTNKIKSVLKADVMIPVQNGGNDDETLDKEDLHSYVLRLEKIYRAYLKNFKKDLNKYSRVQRVMEILLKEYAKANRDAGLDARKVELISKAAYFMDIGKMVVPPNASGSVYETHTIMGAELIWMNEHPSCKFFVEVCGDMCLHHHERYDGKGYPDKLRGGEISFYTQLCGMAEHFDELFYKRSEYNERQFEFVCKEMDVGGQPYGPEVLALLESCEQLIVASYKKMED